MFSTPARRLARWLITGDLPALCPPLLLRLPVGGATVVPAQRIGALLAGPLLKIALLHIALLRRLRDPFLLSLGDCLTILTLLCACPFRGLRFGIGRLSCPYAPSAGMFFPLIFPFGSSQLGVGYHG